MPWPKLFAGHLGEPSAIAQMGIDDATVTSGVAIAAVLSPSDQELTERHVRPLPAGEGTRTHLAESLSFERLGSATIRPSAFPDLLPVRVSKSDPVRDPNFVLSSDDSHHSASF